jgi:very-short-patch-repair endonuclease/predicted transcriptional regulator of viral defense system
MGRDDDPNALHLARLSLVRRQHGLITTAQLNDIGLTGSAVRHHVRIGALYRVHRGVYAVGRPDLGREGRWLAAVLAAGAGAALSHMPAALLWQLLDTGDARPHVTVPSQHGRRLADGLRVHRAATLAASDVTVRLGIPVTSIARTLIDIAGRCDAARLQVAVRQAERLHRLDLAELRLAVEAPRTDHRRARLRRVLDRYVPGAAESALEERFLDLCAREELPPPETQVALGPYRVDFLWRTERFVVETDGAQTHATVVGRAQDVARDRRLAALGFEVARYTWAEVVRTPGDVAREVRAALERRAGLPT